MFNNQVARYLSTLDSPKTLESYSRALFSFHHWYIGIYAEEPSAELLTDVEVREWRNDVSIVRKLSAATVNLHLAAIRSLIRHYGGAITVKGMTKVMSPISPLNGRELGRLLQATDGASWLNQRNRAMLELMVRTGLRVGEMVELQVKDVTLGQRKGEVLVRHGKGMKERNIPLGRQVRVALEAYLAVRPQTVSERLFISRTYQPLSPRDIQRMVQNLAYKAGIRLRVTPHVLRHTFATRALLNKWFHIACAKEGENLTMYIDGVEKGVVAVPAEHDPVDGSTFYIGLTGYRAATFIIDDLVIYNRALTEAESGEIMNGVGTAVSPKGKLAATWASIKY